MKQKFAKIIQEHERCFLHLIFLNDAVKRILTYGVNESDIKIINDAVEFLMRDVKEHYCFEENLVYPFLQDYLSCELIDELIKEHVLITTTVNEFENFLNENDMNMRGEIVQIILKDKSKLLAELLSRHMKKENNLLNKTARQILNEKDFYQLYKERL